MLGLVVHGMAGFDYEHAQKELNIPDDYTVEAMAAIGHPGTVEQLPAAMRASEKPSDRKAQELFVFQGSFAKK